MIRIGLSAVIIAIFTFFTSISSNAEPYAFVANLNEGSISTIDLGTNPPTVYGPFLAGQLGDPAGGLLDIAIVPGGKTALVSNFGGAQVFEVDIRNPLAPHVIRSVILSFFAEDIAIAPNGRFALVTDGGLASTLGIIDLDTFNVVDYILQTPDGDAQCVAIAPDNKTVVLCDYINNRIIYGIVNPNFGLVSESTLPLSMGAFPVNATISPDGQTVMIASAFVTTLDVFRITAPGVLVPGSVVTGVPEGEQSIAFSFDGSRAYLVTTDTDSIAVTDFPDKLVEFLVNGPGDVSLGARSATLLSDSGGQFFGVDVLALARRPVPLGDVALAGNPSSFGNPLTRDVSMVNLDTFSVSTIATDTEYPVGIAATVEQLNRIPTLGEWGMMVTFAGLGLIGLIALKRRAVKARV